MYYKTHKQIDIFKKRKDTTKRKDIMKDNKFFIYCLLLLGRGDFVLMITS